MAHLQTTVFLLALVGSMFSYPEKAHGEASGADPLVEAAIKMAYGGELQGCEDALTKLTEQGERSPLVLWNLSVARVRQDRLGSALHSLMLLLSQNPPGDLKNRALRLKENVTARLVERARREGDPNLFALHDPRTLVERWLALVPTDIWRWSAYLLFWLATIAWLTRSYGPAGLRAIATILATALFLGTGVAAGSDIMARRDRQITRLAVTVEKQALLKEGLVDGAPTRNLPEGVVLEVLDQVTEKLMAVRLADGREGFLDLATIRIVE